MKETLRSVKRSDYRGEVKTFIVKDWGKNYFGRILVFFEGGSVLGRDLLSNIADAVDHGIICGTCYVKPKKRSLVSFVKYGVRNLVNSEKNVDKLFFCSKKSYKIPFEKVILDAKKKKKFKIVKGFVSV